MGLKEKIDTFVNRLHFCHQDIVAYFGQYTSVDENGKVNTAMGVSIIYTDARSNKATGTFIPLSNIINAKVNMQKFAYNTFADLKASLKEKVDGGTHVFVPTEE